MDPLACGDDSLNNNHANTHLPEVVGVARGWEVTQNDTLANITANFQSILSEHYSYATGGSNVNEHWSSPDQLGDAVATSFNADEEPTNSNGFHVRRSASRSLAPLLRLSRVACFAADRGDVHAVQHAQGPAPPLPLETVSPTPTSRRRRWRLRQAIAWTGRPRSVTSTRSS